MSYIVLVIAHSLCAAMMIAVIVDAVTRKDSSVRNSLLFLGSMIFCWAIARVAATAIRDPELAAYAIDLALPFVAFTSVALLLHVLDFFSLKMYYSRVTALLLMVVPMTTLVVALTSNQHEYLRVGRAMLGVWPNFQFVGQPGIWHRIHSGYSYAVVAAAFFVAIDQYRHNPKRYRTIIGRMMAGMLISVLGSALLITKRFPYDLDLGLVGSSLGTLFLALATRDTQGLSFFHQIRGEVFHEIEKAIFILDEEGIVVSLNNTAQDVLALHGETYSPEMSYHEITGRIFREAIEQEYSEIENIGIDYYLPDEKVYNIREKGILNRQGRKMGAIAIWNDVTENRAALRELSIDAGIDALTGLFNRARINKALVELDKPEHYPMAILMADLNNLKYVNDNLGHQQGDLMLRIAAEGMRICCPPKTVLARMGGDEFMGIIPSFPPEQADKLLGVIDDYLAKSSSKFPVQLALGIGVKTSPDEDTQAIIDQADELMYEDKRRKKGDVRDRRGAS